MRLKSLLLLIFLAQVFCATVLGQSSDKAVTSKVEERDSVLAKQSRGIAPAFVPTDIKPSFDRENNPVHPDKMDSRKSIFYSNAKMYVAKNLKNEATPTEATDASIFIQGTAKFDNAAEILQVGEAALTGDFVSLKDDANKTDLGVVKPLFVKSQTENANNTVGLIKFVGKKNKQYIVRENLAGDRIANSLDNTKKVGETTGTEYVMEFPQLMVAKDSLTTVSAIKAATGASGVAGTAYDVREMGLVSVSSNVAMSIEELNTTNGNRFSIDVVSDGLEKDATSVAALAPDYYRLNSAYVDIKKITEGGSGIDAGHSEVNLRMYNATDAASIKRTNTIAVSGGTDGTATFLRGFTSPFNNLRADYMFYHVLTTPSATSITSWQGPVSDPKTGLEAGRGYFMAMDLSREYFDEIQNEWHKTNTGAAELRAKGGYNWSRIVQRMNDEKASFNGAKFSLFTFDATETGGARTHETQLFNVKEVRVDVQGGTGGVINFLGNPFMTPINISGLLAEYDNGYKNDLSQLSQSDLEKPYQPRFFGDNVRAIHKIDEGGAAVIAEAKSKGWVLLRPKYWVPHSALVANTQIGGMPAYAYNVKYDNVSAVMQGQTVPDNDIFDRFIEPMQMFLVQAATTGKFVFTPAMKTFKGKPFVPVFSGRPEVPNTPGARTAATTNDEDNSFIPNDWLVVEAVNGSTADRTAVRFYDGATQGIDGDHDVIKQFSEPAPKNGEPKGLRGIASGAVEVGDPSNAIYTTSAGSVKDKMLSNAVGYNTEEIPLYYISSSNESESVTFTFTGISGFDQVRGVSLVDKFLNSNGTEHVKPLSEGDTYEFTTRVGKETTDNEHRFLLRFAESDNGEGPSLTNDPITCYYSGSILHIGGLNEKDMGSKVQIFDLQGRMMGSTIVNNYPSMEYPKPLGQGTFIVNITGERNYKTKFVNIQNY